MGKFLFLFAFASSIAAADTQLKDCSGDLTANIPHLSRSWFDQDVGLSTDKILANMSPSDGAKGAIIAARTRANPNYYYHWVRDAGLVVEALIGRYQTTASADEKRALKNELMKYVEFSQTLQNTPTMSGLGEPKFQVDGSAFNEAWGRPQNDGPAIRATSLVLLARVLMRENQTDEVKTHLYPMIKTDLDYTVANWRKPSFDLWEEVLGDHFYTRMVQRRGLLEGASLATILGDTATAAVYTSEARAVEQDLDGFWDPTKGIFVTTRNRSGGLDYKASQLDIAFVLGLLHGGMNDGFLAFTDPRVQATIEKTIAAFAVLYPINANPALPGTAIGRYPEDRFSGPDLSGGNPWVLATLAIAEASFRTADAYSRAGRADLREAYIKKAEQFIARVQFHAQPDGSLNEQINRMTGYMTSVSDLTWNYAAILTTAAGARLARGNYGPPTK